MEEGSGPQRVPGWKGRWLSLRSTKPGAIMTTFEENGRTGCT
uniref:Uncharacterized protein n=1 Tax=Nonomuraea gerenzanensis TaxID=93944 RepID=A0A1M4E7Y4_9ACTN|nr:hypothetical protein BN4615_P4497 [Nonomuraea gerenzanensis]